jgi:hypothetical protein
MKRLLQELETAVFRRKPELAGHLLLGLPEASVRRTLELECVKGNVEPIVALFSWRNGTKAIVQFTPEQPSLFPGGGYLFMPLTLMLSQFRRFPQVAMLRLRYAEVVGRYFPLFWNGATDYLALDLDPAGGTRVVVIEDQADKLVREACPTFEDFLWDAIQANKNNEVPAFARQSKKTVAAPVAVAPADRSGRVETAFFVRTGKKIPYTDNPPVLRADFSDEAAWQSLWALIQNPADESRACVNLISDPAFTGLRADQLPALLPEGFSQTFAFIIDRTALTHPGHPILVVDLQTEPGRHFRAVAAQLGHIESNLSIANMSFDEFADAVDKEGVFHGF